MTKAIWADERVIETTIGALAHEYAVEPPEGLDHDWPVVLWRHAEKCHFDGWHIRVPELDCQLADEEWAPRDNEHATQLARALLPVETTEQQADLIGRVADEQGVTEIATSRWRSTPGGGFWNGENLRGTGAQMAAQIKGWRRPSAAIDAAKEALGLWF